MDRTFPISPLLSRCPTLSLRLPRVFSMENPQNSSNLFCGHYSLKSLISTPPLCPPVLLKFLILYLYRGMAEPMLLSSPLNTKRQNQITHSLTSLLDVTPTILDWFGLKHPKGDSYLSGKSLLPLLDFEELLKILPLKKSTQGEYIYNVFKTYAAEIGLLLKKLSAITTDGAPAMIGKSNDFVTLCKKDKCFPNFMSYHCIINQEALCAKILPFGHIIDIVTLLCNTDFFKALLEDSEDKKVDLILHAEVQWLSRGKVLSSKHIEKLSDSSWLLDLAFLADITEKLNILNLHLQGKDKELAQMMGSVKAFKAKLTLWISQMRSKSLVHFPNTKKMTNDNATNEWQF
ncbi:hypothetical protein J437_LFUL006265 [Ladona fulva]|uniref:Uncharacterized protein n=1 Tax=Ladona fulva TaxID=123851 RepID=A0A8K0JZQ6_LADFU|nr:hypothetical protein J437_LFUL006265 [Ladona fulva]